MRGIRPYSVRTKRTDLDPASRQALRWFAEQVPERTLHNWQDAAARLVAADLRAGLRASRKYRLAPGWQWLAADFLGLAVLADAPSRRRTGTTQGDPMTTNTTSARATVRMTGLLRQVLLGDGLACVATGVIMLPFAGWLESALGLPLALILGPAAYLIAYGAWETYVATRPTATRATGWFSPTTAGTAVIAVLGAGVLAVTLLQEYAYRRASS